MDNINKVCKFDGCNEEAKSRGYCKKHYTLMYRLGTFDKEISKNKDKTCSVVGCNEKVYGKGLCSKHYQRLKRHGDPNYESVVYHGLSKTREYHVWKNIKDRCFNNKNNAYKNYGERGITMCDSWRDSFVNFINDMGFCPDPKMQIDRINNNGNYEPSNCRWVTQTQNARNKRSNVLSMKKAREIRSKYKAGKGINALAREYGTTHPNITDVIRNKIWKEV